MTSRPQTLVLSFSPIARDARVMRHISVLSRMSDVVSCGFGPRPPHVVEHLQVPELPSLPQTPRGVALLATRRLRAAERAAPALAAAGALLAGRRFDLVMSNDARALPIAHDVAAGAPVWADMHEWAPQERSHDLRWRLLVAPLATHLCREYLPRSAAVTTVGSAIADLYAREFGVRCEVVRNAAPFADLRPSPALAGRVRLVHSGGAVPGRNIELLIEATRAAGERFTLDLYLVPAADGGRYLQRLRDIASGDPRIVFHEPVTPDELPRTLNQFDLGVYSIPPINVNTRYALPNKFFDFVQGRLGVVIGPSVEMVSLTRAHDLGVVADDFTAASFTAALTSLTDEAVSRYKANADAAAHELSSERDEAVTLAVAERLVAGS